MVSPREIEITLTKPVPANLLKNGTRVVENITWTPRVHIARCHFSRIPTRGILITTRQPSVIEDNYFYGMQMSAILVADDARSWFESGPVHNLIIRNNTFNRCAKFYYLDQSRKPQEGWCCSPQYHHREQCIHSAFSGRQASCL